MDNAVWIEDELSLINMNDFRLDKRLTIVARDLINSPSESIQTASGKWSDAKAAYRLFNHENLTEQKIIKAHQDKTIERLNELDDKICLAIQDTTKLNYTHHPKKEGLGKLNQSAEFANPLKGCLLHSTLLTTGDGLPIGLLDQKIYKHTEKDKKNKQIPITEKESYRWLESLQETSKLTCGKNIITVCDRESDIFEFFVEAEKLNSKILIRASFNRILFKRKHHNHENLWPFMKKQEIKRMVTLDLPKRHNKKERKATLEVRYAKIVVMPPQRSPKAQLEKLEEVNLNAVYVVEPNPPQGEEPLEWMLLTNLEISDAEDACKVVKWYRMRWQIENFHRVLKSGCNIENCRLETYDRLKKIITLKSIIAFRLLYLTHVNRHNPEESCEKVLTKTEWRALYCKIYKTKVLPPNPPTVQDAVLMIAKLGGFLARKNDGNPGMTYIWKGWAKLCEISELWEILQDEVTYG